MSPHKWENKTLESLEKSVWPELSELDKQDWLIVECNALRKKPIKDFTIENLRQMIEQNIGLEFLIPIAIDELEKNILAEGDCYPGDLLGSVLNCDKKYWQKHKEHCIKIQDLFQENKSLLKSIDTTWEIKNAIFDSYKNFSMIHTIK